MSQFVRPSHPVALGYPLASSRSSQLCIRALYSPVVSSGSALEGENLSVKLGLPQGVAAPTWEIRMLFDGDCPLCMREVNMLRDMDKGDRPGGLRVILTAVSRACVG
jgi:hypothetical protein